MLKRMYLSFVVLAIGVVIGSSLNFNYADDPNKAEKQNKPISFEEVRKRGVLGELGHPLGTIVTVEGDTAADNYRKLRKDLGCTLLRVKSVNGVELKQEVVFQFHSANEDKPKVGIKFKYTGYETAGFEGIVEGSEKFIGRLPGVGYSFQNSFHIFKDELNPKKE